MKAAKKFLGTLTIALALASHGQGQPFLTNGLIAYYPFNGNALDASGNGNDGTVQGAVLTKDRMGSPSTAYSFDGTSSRIVVPETLFGPTEPAWTISVWITTDGGPYTGGPNWQTIFSKGTQNGEMSLQVSAEGQIFFSPHLANYTNGIGPMTPVQSNNVIHIVGVYEKGQAASLYTNGVLAGSVAIPDDSLFVWTDYPLFSAIGAYNFTPSPYAGFRGAIDDVRVYRRALSPSEVQQLYVIESGFQVTLIKAVRPAFSGLVLGTGYQVQVSGDLATWTNSGSPFTATNSAMMYPQYFDVDNWDRLFFRLQVAP
jgi:hypothetical protein